MTQGYFPLLLWFLLPSHALSPSLPDDSAYLSLVQIPPPPGSPPAPLHLLPCFPASQVRATLRTPTRLSGPHPVPLATRPVSSVPDQASNLLASLPPRPYLLLAPEPRGSPSPVALFRCAALPPVQGKGHECWKQKDPSKPTLYPSPAARGENQTDPMLAQVDAQSERDVPAPGLSPPRGPLRH